MFHFPKTIKQWWGGCNKQREVAWKKQPSSVPSGSTRRSEVTSKMGGEPQGLAGLRSWVDANMWPFQNAADNPVRGVYQWGSSAMSQWESVSGATLVSCSENEKTKNNTTDLTELASKWITERRKAGEKSESSKYWFYRGGAGVGSCWEVGSLEDHHSICLWILIIPCLSRTST